MAAKTDKSQTRRQKTDAVRRQELNQFVASCDRLDGVDVRVFLYLSGLLNFDTPVAVPQIHIAEVLQRRKPHISRSIKNLVDAGVLAPGPNGTRSSELMLNPDYGT
jgi:predicted transcriptional regulator